MVRVLYVVTVNVIDISEKIWGEVELYVVPVICSPVCDQTIEVARDAYEHLMNLRLADSSVNETQLVNRRSFLLEFRNE